MSHAPPGGCLARKFVGTRAELAAVGAGRLSGRSCRPLNQPRQSRKLQLPSLASADVADVLATIRARVLRLLRRRGVIEDDPSTGGLELLPTEAAEREPVLAQLSAAAVTGRVPAGPERRERPPIRLVPDAAATITGALRAADSGFTLHAATTARRDDLAGKEARVRYVLRPPLAQDRVRLLDDGMVRIVLKRPFSDGTTAVDMDPLSLLCRLATSVPGPGFHTVRYGGILAPAARWRAAVVPEPKASDDRDDWGDGDGGNKKPATHRSGYRPWAELLKRSFVH